MIVVLKNTFMEYFKATCQELYEPLGLCVVHEMSERLLEKIQYFVEEFEKIKTLDFFFSTKYLIKLIEYK